MRSFRIALAALPGGLALARLGAGLLPGISQGNDNIASSLRASSPSASRTNKGDRPRAVFVAGLEGSGHHLLEDLWHILREARGFNFRELAMPPSWHCGMKWDQARGWIDMVHAFDGLDAGVTYLLPAKASYPCGSGSHADRRDMFFPHADWVSEVAFDAGADFHVLLLYRPIEQILASDCLHRRFEDSCALAAETIEANAAHLVDQIAVMRKAHGSHKVNCMVYGDVPQMISSIEQVIGDGTVSVNATVRSLWQEPTRVDLSRIMPLPAEVVERLTYIDKQLLSICTQVGARASGAR